MVTHVISTLDMVTPPYRRLGEVHEYVLAGLPQLPGYEATHFVVRYARRLMERFG
jgi:hypothetical protein